MWDKIFVVLAALGTLMLVVVVICICALVITMFYMGIKKSMDEFKKNK